MPRRRDKRGRATGRLGMERGERYALLKREVLESEAFRALPDWAVRVVLGLCAQYYPTRNGNLALPIRDARLFGINAPWKLYAGLKTLEASNLIECTRRGHVSGGRRLASLYALTWWPIDEPAPGVTYDAAISPCPTPTNAWANWVKPTDWKPSVQSIVYRARGRPRNTARSVTRTSGSGRTTTLGAT